MENNKRRNKTKKLNIAVIGSGATALGVIKTLLEREWIRVVGHKEVPGRPALYATTAAFLDYFSLAGLDELPPLPELQESKINQLLSDPSVRELSEWVI